MIAIRFLPAAEAELLDATEHYAAGAPELAVDFLDEVERALERIASFPEHGSPHLAGSRRVTLPRFFIDLVYVLEERALIIAVAHHRRKPGYWRSRVPPRA